MPCYHPLAGYKSKAINPATGKRSVVFKLSSGLASEPVLVPCGRCIGCRLETSRQWAMRCVHEAQLHEDSSFVTLTYEQKNLPYGGTLIKKDYQDFMKRLRRSFDGQRISYYHCGEYGEKTRRPHYHALLFGVRFVDRLPYTRGPAGHVVYTSERLSDLWGLGFASCGEVTFESAAYVARYVMKKITGAAAADHYKFVDPGTGEITWRLPEYTTMSLKPAIAKEWFAEFKDDAYPSDFLTLRGKRMKPPKYYDKLLELHDVGAYEQMKAARRDAALAAAPNSTRRRLAEREEVKLAQISNLKRSIE